MLLALFLTFIGAVLFYSSSVSLASLKTTVIHLVKMQEDEFETVLVYISVIALLFQFYVLYLIQTKSHGGIQNYKYFLNSTIIWDIVFTFLYGIAFRATPVLRIFSVCGLAHYFGHMGTVVTVGFKVDLKVTLLILVWLVVLLR